MRIALDALAGLQAAHVLHDDEGKPSASSIATCRPHNVLIGCDGSARLTDFGIAKAADRVQTTRTHEVKGKLAYLAPERIDKRRLCTVQSDVFSMAVVLWECIAGRRLFRGDEAIETLQEVMTGAHSVAPSHRCARFRRRSTTRSCAASRAISTTRYKTAAEFADALERAPAGRANIATPAEVALLVEALFGERLRVRHANIREALGDADDVIQVLEVKRPSRAARAHRRDARA